MPQYPDDTFWSDLISTHIWLRNIKKQPKQKATSLFFKRLQFHSQMNENSTEKIGPHMTRSGFWYDNLSALSAPISLQYWAESIVHFPKGDSNKEEIRKFHFPYLIAADPTDKLTLLLYDEYDFSLRMHSITWLHALDYLLYRRLTLALRDDGITINLQVPEAVQDKYADYIDQSKMRRKKLPNAPPSYLQNPGKGHNFERTNGYITFQVPRFLEPLHLNLFFHDIFTQPNHKKWLRDPRRDSILCTLNGMGSLPNYQLEDYVAHELKTGISLSTEITAVVLELDEAIREVALEAFYTRALDDLIRFPFPYARNTAARNFFQQISSEWARKKYAWNPADTKGGESEILADSFRRARIHVDLLLAVPLQPPKMEPFQVAIRTEQELQDILQQEKAQREDPMLPKTYKVSRNPASGQVEYVYAYPIPYLPAFPNTKNPVLMDSYMEQIDAYLQAVQAPLDWSALKEKPPAHLAIFTNQKHKYIPLLLNYLKTTKMKKHFRGDILPFAGKECKALYSTIHMKIRNASMKAYADMNWIKEYMERE